MMCGLSHAARSVLLLAARVDENTREGIIIG